MKIPFLNKTEDDPQRTLDAGTNTGEVRKNSPAAEVPEEEEHSLRRLLIKTGVIIIAAWVLLHFVFGIYHLKGNRMYPALKDGDLIITYRLEVYKPSEVVAYRHDEKVRFGRIAAFPGSTIDADEEGLTVDGVHLSEEVFYPTLMGEGCIDLPYIVPADCYFVLNDYRIDKSDSRSFGAVSRSDMQGKVIYIFRRRGF